MILSFCLVRSNTEAPIPYNNVATSALIRPAQTVNSFRTPGEAITARVKMAA